MNNTLQTHQVRHQAYTAGSWAGGATRGIWAESTAAIAAPATACCWAGTATIERDAPYSHFAGRHRLQVLIRGPELRLRFREPDEEVVLARGAQHQFDGTRPVEAILPAGPVVAFNLIYRADVLATAMVATIGPDGLLWPLGAVAELGVEHHRVPVRLIYVVDGAIGVESVAAFVAADDTLVVAPPRRVQAGAMLRLNPTGVETAEAILATLWLPADSVS